MRTKHLARPFVVKSTKEDGSFSGYASVFGVVDSYGDVVEPGAFKASLSAWKEKGQSPALLWQHRADEPIGKWTKLEEDEKGLYAEGLILLDAGDTERRAYAHLKAGSVSGLSIGYSIPRGGAEWDPKSETYRLRQVDLWEASLVTFPANEEAQVETVKAALASPRDFERWLVRDAGLSARSAKALMSGGYKALVAERDAADEELKEALQKLHDQMRALRA
jgi:uncharacterized protein